MSIRNHNFFLGFDFETENANLINARPWQLGFILDNYGKTEIHNYYIKWNDLNISEGAKRITGFNESIYKKEAKDPLEVLNIFNKYFLDEKYYLFGHNILGFDCLVYNVWLRALDLEENYKFLPRTLDTLSLEKAIHLKIDLSGKKNLFKQLGLANRIVRGTKLKLSDLAKKYEIEVDESKLHDANYDIIINHKIFKKQIWKLKI